ncbi:MAG: glycosyltransferase [bacterium]
MLVYFCEALHTLRMDINLVAMGINVLEEEIKTNDPLDLYRIRKKFPTRIVHMPVQQDSSGCWWALNRLCVHVTQALRFAMRTNANERVVFYTRNYSSILAFLLMRRWLRRKVVVVMEIHTTPGNFLQRLLLPRADGIVANSFALKHDLTENGFLPSTQVLGTHMGVDFKLYDELRISKLEARDKLGLPVDKKLALYTGKIYWGYQEIQYLLAAARRLPSTIELVLVGGRADHVHLWRELITKENISNVIFTGFVPPNVVQYYQMAADVLLLYYPSGMELNKYRSPGKLFEYMASGRPIIAADYPVLREVLGDDPVAVLVPPDAPHLLAQNIVTLLTDQTQMEELAARALERVRQFTWEIRARRIQDFVKTIAQGA